MASLRSTALRHLSGIQVQPLRSTQRRWARVRDVRFVGTQQNQERILDRYKDKLDRKAKEKGYGGFTQLRAAYQDKIKEFRKKAVVPGVTASFVDAADASPRGSQQQQNKSSQSPWPQPPPPPKPQSQSKPPGLKTLDSFLDVSKILELPRSDIETLWKLRHAKNPQSLCAAMPTATFAAIAKTARAHPQFILPGLPPTEADAGSAKPEGAIIHFLQWTFPAEDTLTVMFTHLAEYKLRGEYAQPHTTLTHHLELAEPKGVVLAQGSVVEGRGVSVDEGKWLVMCMQKFYNTPSPDEMELLGEAGISKELKMRRRRLMEQFSQGDDAFTMDQLLAEAETLG